MPDPSIDVVVPVYNGYDAVERCLKSVLAHTPGDHVRIVVADDASPDPRIPGLLASFAGADSRVTVVRRAENVGFVRNCNLAMGDSTSDVVLLNSDTEVPPGWLERLCRLARSSSRIGSVTPISNNATICSVPQWLVANAFPDEMSVPFLDEVAQASGTGQWMEIPTSVGFCVYLRRDALDACGLFDESQFGAGYGEENDLACRMRNGGYLNLLCDTVFVRHEGGVSFAEAGTGDLQGNLARIGSCWPSYHEVIRQFIDLNPLWGVQARFGIELLRRTKQPGRLRVLYLIHNQLWSGVIGGTELHLTDLIASLGNRLDPVVLSFDGTGRATVQWQAGGRGPLAFPIHMGIADDPAEWLRRLLATGVDVIHVQHTVRAPLPIVGALFDEAATAGIPVAWTLHDYICLCPAAQLLDAASGAPCTSLAGGPPCEGCEERAGELAGMSVAEWRQLHRDLLGRADALFTPSGAAREVIASAYPELGESIRVHAHGIAPGAVALPAASGHRPSIVVLGYGGRHKGDELLGDIMDAACLSGVTWHLIGREQLGERPRPNVRLHGTYRREDLPQLLESVGADLALLLSPWPETYSYTLSEAWRQGLPVVGSDLGAMGERIRSQGGGLAVDPWDPAAVAAVLQATLADSATMERLRREAAANGRALPTLSEMAAFYHAAYVGLVPEVRAAAAQPLPVTPDAAEMRGWMGSFQSPLRS